MNTAPHFSSKCDTWATPQAFFDEVNERYGFTLDVCALPSSAKCARYFTPETDGLAQDWAPHVCWMNPPYGREIGAWMVKAVEEWRKGATVVALVPARTDTRWFQDYAMQGAVTFIRGRLKFGQATNSAPFPSALVVYEHAPQQDVGTILLALQEAAPHVYRQQHAGKHEQDRIDAAAWIKKYKGIVT